MKNKIFTYTNVNKFARELLPNQSGLYLVKGSIKLDDTHLSPFNETFLVILTYGEALLHSLVICSQGGYYDDVKVWSGEDIKALQAAVDTIQNTKQDRTDMTLATQAKSVAGAINELFGGGVKDKSIALSKLAQAVQDALGMIGTNVKVLPEGTSLVSQTLEDGIWIVLPTGRHGRPPIQLMGYRMCLLVVNQSSDIVMIFGIDGTEDRLPVFATRHYLSKTWEGSPLLSGAAGKVNTANLANGAVTPQKLAKDAVLSVNIADMAVKEAKLDLKLADKINGAAQKAAVSKALEVIELTDNNTQNKAAIDARIAKLTELGLDLTNGYAIPISYISGNKEYHGMVTAGKNSLLNGIVSDAQGQSYFGISIGATDGIVTFEETDPLVFKSEMSSAIDTLVECVEFTKTTLSNKAHLDAYLAKLPNAKVMCCTYNGGYAGTLHKINGSWYGVLVSESNTLAGQLSIKLQADGTIIEGTA